MSTQVMTRSRIAARMLEMADRLEARAREGLTDDMPIDMDRAMDAIDSLALRNMAEAMKGRL